MNRHRAFGVAALVVVGAALVAGLVFVGPPAQERERKIDQQRVRDLNGLAMAIELYWLRYESLPPDLEALETDPVRAKLPSDPVTGAAYRYEALGPESFRLCAVFSAEAETETVRAVVPNRFAAHRAGEDCFEVALPVRQRRGGE